MSKPKKKKAKKIPKGAKLKVSPMAKRGACASGAQAHDYEAPQARRHCGASRDDVREFGKLGGESNALAQGKGTFKYIAGQLVKV